MATSTIQHRASPSTTDEGVPSGSPASAFVLGALDAEGKPSTALPVTMRFTSSTGSARVQLYVRDPAGAWHAASSSRTARHGQRVLLPIAPLAGTRFAFLRVTGASSAWSMTAEAGVAQELEAEAATGASSQGAWYVTTATGSDGADGTSSSTALRSLGELVRRWNADPSPFTADQVVYVTGDVAERFAFTVRQEKLNGHVVHVRTTAAKTTHATGTLSAATAITYAGAGAATTITGTLSSGTWTTHRGRKIVITGPALNPRIGAWAWIDEDLGGDVAVTSPFLPAAANFATPDSTAPVTPAASDEFAIVSDYAISVQPLVDMSSSGGSSYNYFDLIVEGFRLTGTYAQGAGFRGGAAALVGCSWEDWHPIEGAGSVWCFGTRVAAFLGADESALLWLGACYLDGIAGAYVSAYGAGASRVHVVGDTLISQGASVDSDTTLKLGKVCVRHNSADALICWAGRLRISDATKVYGSGNTNQILVLAGGTVGIYSATGLAGLIATSSAAVMDFRNSKTKAWADLPFVANALPADSQAMLILQ